MDEHPRQCGGAWLEPDRSHLREGPEMEQLREEDRKSTRLNSSHEGNSYAVFCLKKKRHQHWAKLTDTHNEEMVIGHSPQGDGRSLAALGASEAGDDPDGVCRSARRVGSGVRDRA